MLLTVMFGSLSFSALSLRYFLNSITFVQSKESVCVSCAIVERLATIFFAITFLIEDIFSSLNAFTSTFSAFVCVGATAAGAVAAFGLTLASLTSRSIILPFGPVGVAVARSTPNFSAKFLALGDANILPLSD